MEREAPRSVMQNTAEENLPRRHRPDYGLLILSAVLLLIGLIVIYSISPGLSRSANVGENYYIYKQLLAVGLGVAAFAVAANMPLGLWRRLQKPLIVVAALLAIAVRLVGQQVNGAYRWIQIGGISFQSAELIKIALLVWLAGFLSDKIHSGDLADNKQALRPVLIALAILAVVVAGIQSDLGSLGVMVVMIAAMVFIAGMPMKKVVTIGLIVVAVVILAVAVTPYRRGRLLTFLHPSTSNCASATSSSYQACQALISVGSGGLLGLGLGRSVQAYGYLPESANDSIFAIYSEKFGFIGDVVLLGLFAAFFTRIKRIAERAPNNFSRLLAVGILAWLSTQTLINIGAMIGLLPLKGITLPLISYGGTSILFVMVAIGILFQISRYTNYVALRDGQREGKPYDNHTDRRRLRRAYNAPVSSRTRA